MRRSSFETVLPMVLVLALLALHYGVFLPHGLVNTGRNGLITSVDLSGYFLPRFWLGSQEVLAGRLPLWNPYEYGGIPLLATTQPAALYPPKVLAFALLPPVPALFVFLAAHHVLAAVSFHWFLREEGLRGPPLFVGVSAWALSSMVLVSNYHPIRIACLAWMPLLFVLSSRVARGIGGRRTFALLAASVGFQLLCGYPEATMDIGLLVALHLAVRHFQGAVAAPPWRTVPEVAAAFALGAAAAGLQLVPLAELSRVAEREAVAGQWQRATAGLPPGNPFLPFFLGFTAFVVVAVSVREARSAVLGLFACVGIAAFGLPYLRRIPGFSLVRFPFTWVVLAVFFFAWAAASGAAALVPREPSDDRRVAVRLFGALAFLGTAIAWYVLSRAPAPAGAVPGSAALSLASFVATPVRTALVVVAALGVAALALATAFSRRAPKGAWYVPLVLTVLGQLAAFPFGNQPAAFAPPDRTGIVGRAGLGAPKVTGRVVAPVDLPWGHEITDRVPSALGVEQSFLPYRWVLLSSRLALALDFMAWETALPARGFWNAMDVQYLAVPDSRVQLVQDGAFRKVAHVDEHVLYENPGRMGYAWVNYAVRREPSLGAALEHVTSPEFDPDREVVVEAATARTYPATTDLDVTVPTEARRLSPTEVELDVTLPRPGVLVVSESAYPGWVARVDGTEKPWLTVDYVLRGVELDTGSHHVRWSYEPRSVRIGAALSALGILVIALLGWARRTPRPEGPRPPSA